MKERQLSDLVSVGRATLRDFAKLGVRSVRELAACDPNELYARISLVDGVKHDPCLLDVFRCAVAQARDPGLRGEKCRWWYWSRVRKGAPGNGAAHGPPGP